MSNFIEYLDTKSDNLIFALLLWMFTYFAEIKGSVTLMEVAFLVDLIVGILKTRIIDNEKFSSKKFWRHIMRFMFVLIISMLLLAMDRESGITSIHLYNGFSWLVTGWLIYSIAENAFALTDWKFFIILKKFLSKKIEQATEIDIEKDKTEDKN